MLRSPCLWLGLVFAALFLQPTAVVAQGGTRGLEQRRDRVNDLVQQALQLAGDESSAASGQALNTDPGTGVTLPNPFGPTSATPAGAGSPLGLGINDLPGAERPSVEFRPGGIDIRVGGQALTVPVDPTYPPSSYSLTYPPKESHAWGVMASPATPMAQARYWETFAAGVAAFRSGDYPSARQHFETCHQHQPNDSILPPFLSLSQFAETDYAKAAEFAYAAASAGKQWKWADVTSLYGQTDDYAAQYVRLQQAARQADADTSTHFLLGWHHLMLGHRAEAVAELEIVARQLPTDPVIQACLREARQPVPTPPAPLQ